MTPQQLASLPLVQTDSGVLVPRRALLAPASAVPPQPQAPPRPPQPQVFSRQQQRAFIRKVTKDVKSGRVQLPQAPAPLAPAQFASRSGR